MIGLVVLFNLEIGIIGVILIKFDGDFWGGVVLSVKEVINYYFL